MSHETTHDPATYRRLSEPYPSRADAEKAIYAFHEELRALREKHRVRDVNAVWSFSYLSETGEEIESVGRAHIGAVEMELPMLAWAYGRAEEAFAEDMSRFRKGGRK